MNQEYLQCFDVFQSFEHFMLNIFQTVTGEKNFIYTSCAFKGSLLNIGDLIVAKVAR